MEGTESRNIIKTHTPENAFFPDQHDLIGASEALIRLQHIYLLNTSVIAEGNIEGTHLSSEFTAADCFQLGKQAYENKYFNYTLIWMQETLKRLEKEKIKSADRLNTMEYITYAAYDVADFELGLDILDKILKLNPNYPRLNDNLSYYQAKVKEWEYKKHMNMNEKTDDLFTIDGISWSQRNLLENYKRLCRGESMKTLKENSQLHCHYTINNNGYLFLQPVKTEILSLEPRIVMFYDVLSDNESKTIKQAAAPKLQRAIIQNSISGKEEITTERISKSTLLKMEDEEMLAKINKRIEVITGLSDKYSEEFNVINYGIGGHYDPHFDFAQSADKVDMFRELGNRIATWIFYLSDVPAGGSTVFPVSGVAVKPVKGSAGFWYNLFRNGEGDKRTLHAACPVLAGSKWVSNKWLHEKGQEFRRPCSLNPKE